MMSQVFEDLKLEQLLNHYLNENQTKNVIDHLKNPLSASEIKAQQQLFIELQQPDTLQFFIDLIHKLWNLHQKYKVYYRSQDQRYQAIYYLHLLNYYLELSQELINDLAYQSTSSATLTEFIDSFTSLYQSPEYNQLKSDTKDLLNELSQLKSLTVNIDIIGTSPHKVTIKNSRKPQIFTELDIIANELGVTSTRLSKQPKEMTSPFMEAFSNLHPGILTQLAKYYQTYQSIFKLDIESYIRHISFFLDLNQFYTAIRSEGIPLVMPKLSKHKRIKIDSGYDISLLLKKTPEIIPNDINFNESRGFFILTGANGGGKTSYLRLVGICQVLAMAGGYVPAVAAEIYPLTKIFTHFPAEESLKGVGRLQEERGRVAKILADVDHNSLVLLNETFSSTNADLSVEYSLDLLEELCRKGAFGIFVTHQHQLTEKAQSIREETAISYLTAAVLEDQEHTRTYKILFKQSANLSYAQTIIEKYGLSRAQLLERFGGEYNI